MLKPRWNRFGVLLAASVLGAAATDEPAKGQSAQGADERAIRAVLDALVQALNKADTRAIAALFTEDGEAVDADGATLAGRQAIEEHYGSRFGSGSGEKVASTVESVKLLAPGVARVTGRTEVTLEGGAPPLKGRFSALEVQRDGRWLLASLREVADHEIGHHEHLEELQWLVGDWVEETTDAVILTSVAWVDNQKFLLRTFDVRMQGKPALTGTQRIGWDPLTRQIKSWTFDSQGGYGEALWTRSGDQWALKATGVRPDGRVATATQVLTRVNKDTLRWKSMDRTLGPNIEPAIDEIVMVRKPPQPRRNP
jgi:uncharacterized protein (TIGR02246 family)